ncbi:MAG TPA: ABC transporter substrate-binding protein [Chthoniobacterales bacterium]|nr:ABC transporter substrate-binding protein [Chthoniobacterales bacterium]
MLRAAFIFGLVVLVGLSGCSRGPAAIDGVVHLSMLMDMDRTGIWHELIAEFEANNPGIRVHYIEGPTSTGGREDLYVTSFLSGKNVYDLIMADTVWVVKFAAAGWLEDLTERWPNERWAEFIPGTIEGSKYRDRIYRVPTTIDAGVLYYRTDLLQSAGEGPPQTFEALVRIAQKLQQPEQLWGFVWQGKQYEGLVCNFLEVLAGFGGEWVDPETNEVRLDQPEAIAALQWMRDCIHAHRISPPGTTAYQEEEARLMFQSGRALFQRNWPYIYTLAQQEGSAVRGRVGLIPMPASAHGRSASTLGGWGFCIAKNSPHKEAAWRFVEFISALPQVRRMQASGGSPPALKRFYEESDDPAQKAIYEVFNRTVTRPRIPQYAQASDILQRYLSAALTQRMTPHAAMNGAARETRLLLQR